MDCTLASVEHGYSVDGPSGDAVSRPTPSTYGCCLRPVGERDTLCPRYDGMPEKGASGAALQCCGNDYGLVCKRRLCHRNSKLSTYNRMDYVWKSREIQPGVLEGNSHGEGKEPARTKNAFCRAIHTAEQLSSPCLLGTRRCSRRHACKHCE